MEDEELVARVRAGDFDAASTLLSRYQDVAFTVALRLMGQPADAEDIAQEALFRAYGRLTDLDEKASFEPWLRRITINLSLNALRRRGRFKFESLDATLGDRMASQAQAVAKGRPSTEDAALESVLRDEIERYLSDLPVEQRVAVVLSDMYGYDISDIAHLQRCGLSAAKMRISRGRDRLRSILINARVLSDGSNGDDAR